LHRNTVSIALNEVDLDVVFVACGLDCAGQSLSGRANGKGRANSTRNNVRTVRGGSRAAARVPTAARAGLISRTASAIAGRC
jgi:hypothetical protein